MSEFSNRLIPLSDVEARLWTCTLKVNRFLWKKASFEQQIFIQKKLAEYQADLNATLEGLLIEYEQQTNTQANTQVNTKSNTETKSGKRAPSSSETGG